MWECCNGETTIILAVVEKERARKAACKTSKLACLKCNDIKMALADRYIVGTGGGIEM